MLAIAVIAADERAYKNPVQRIMTGIYDYYTTVGLVVAIRSDYKIPRATPDLHAIHIHKVKVHVKYIIPVFTSQHFPHDEASGLSSIYHTV